MHDIDVFCIHFPLSRAYTAELELLMKAIISCLSAILYQTYNKQSRHTSSIKYRCWISCINTTATSWYCNCKAEARVVGSCAHVASVRWYLWIGGYYENKWPRIWYVMFKTHIKMAVWLKIKLEEWKITSFRFAIHDLYSI